MCDCPMTTIYTTRETVKCNWIVYSRRTDKDGNVTQGAQQQTEMMNRGGGGEVEETSRTTTELDPALDNVYLMLEPHLRPVTPDLELEQSKKIFEEHKQLAHEYLKVQTELAYLSQHRNELLEQKGSEQISRREQLQEERDNLATLHQKLLQQLEILQNAAGQEPRTPVGDGWVVVPRQ